MPRIRRWGRAMLAPVCLLLALACAAPAPSTSAPAAPGAGPSGTSAGAASVARTSQRLRVSYGATVGVHVPILLAQRLGEFEREGLDVEVQRVPTNTSITALLAGDLDLVQVSAPALVSADLQGGADLVFVAGALDRMIINLYAMPSIRSGADLRGKVLGSDRPGTPVAFAAGLSLARLGLSLGDVEVLPVGSEGIVPGMAAGQIQAGPLALPNSSQALRLGGHLMVDLRDVSYQNIGIILRRSEIERLANALPGFLRVYRHGIQRFPEDPPWSKEVLAGLIETDDEALVQETYDFFTKQVPFTPSLRVSRDGLQGVLDSLRDVLPAASTADPDQFYDHRFVDALDRGS